MNIRLLKKIRRRFKYRFFVKEGRAGIIKKYVEVYNVSKNREYCVSEHYIGGGSLTEWTICLILQKLSFFRDGVYITDGIFKRRKLKRKWRLFAPVMK